MQIGSLALNDKGGFCVSLIRVLITSYIGIIRIAGVIGRPSFVVYWLIIKFNSAQIVITTTYLYKTKLTMC